jgi:N-acetylglucosaminyldiphosphoundecaprenol N-acetyl-beta-D-mannosaminyltransferase
MVQIVNTFQPTGSESVYVLGVRVDRVTQEQELTYIEQAIERHKRGEIPCQQIITVNPEFVMMAQKDEVFRSCINGASLVVADGIGIVLATRYLHRPTPERITGVDTVQALAKLCMEHNYRLYLLGAGTGVAEEAAQRLQERMPDLQIAGTYAGSPDVNEEGELIERVRASRADILCVAYGAPAQDLWIGRNLGRLPVGIAMGVGGAFDFIAGRQRRAPRVMQKVGLEWLYRLYREPWRWRRMLALPKFAGLVLLKGRAARGA